MKIVKQKKLENEEYMVVTYQFDETILPENIADVAKMFENDSVKMNECTVFSYDEDESCLTVIYNSTDELKEVVHLPNPAMSFYLGYVDRKTGEYRFGMNTCTNNLRIEYVVDKKRKKIEQ